MAETTTFSGEMTRTELAEFLRAMADELDSGHGKIRIPLGNKEVTLSPPETVDVETTVTERSRRLRKDVEEVDLCFDWNPTQDTVSDGSDAETEAPEKSESDSGPSR
jgi:amphi-Trp domain-containing protein